MLQKLELIFHGVLLITINLKNLFFRFHTGNSQKLIEEMSKEEKLSFEVDARNIDWRKYFQEIHIPGLRKHIINGTRTTSI